MRNAHGARTGRRKLGAETFAHDALQAHAGTDEPDGDEREGVGPSGVPAVGCDAAGTALPDGDGADHGEKRLDERAQGQPCAGLAPDLVAEATDKGTEDETEDGTEGLLIGDVERVVMLAVEQACERQCKLRGR